MGAGIHQQIVVDEDGRKTAVELAGDVGIDVPVRRARAEEGYFHGGISFGEGIIYMIHNFLPKCNRFEEIRAKKQKKSPNRWVGTLEGDAYSSP
jgi:hypothetical protein